MFDFIILILLCIFSIFAIGDLFFNALGFGLKILFSIILIIASTYLIVKMCFILIPWMLYLSIMVMIIGIIWLIKTVVKRI